MDARYYMDLPVQPILKWYPINTLKRAKAAIKLAHFSPHQESIIKNVAKIFYNL